jgi:cytochrome oxidase Cu insertion factor (SCO1/SenC/PrrC family)
VAGTVPGMNSGLSPNDPTLEAAFRSALIHQGVIAAVILAALLVLWGVSRDWVPAAPAGSAVPAAEPLARRVLRIGFGVLWLLDGILQAQPQMPGGLPSQIIEPTAQSSPGWVQRIVDAGGTVWSNHPIQLAAASVWVQVGIGLWLLVAVRGRWSRAAGVASVAWGLVVWILGESFGGIFAPGLSWLTGAPGAALLYCGAGALVALPAAAWGSRHLGRLLLAGAGLFFLGMAVLQAWPGRGFWRGTIHGQPGTLAGAISQQAQMSQPRALDRVVSAFGSLDAAHGFAVNLAMVIALAIVGTGLLAGVLAGDRRVTRATVIAAGALCLPVWVLVQDLGFLGGLGTDPNSMIPTMLLLAGGYLASTQAPVAALSPPAMAAQREATHQAEPVAPQEAVPGEAVPGEVLPQEVLPQDAVPQGTGTWLRAGRERLLAALAATTISTAAAIGAVGVVIIGVAPMALAATHDTADPIVAQAVSGLAPPVDTPAPGFQLTGTNGRSVTLASLRGKVVLLTFLDAVCTTDCPVIAQEFKIAAQLLGRQDRNVEIVAISANPSYYGIEFTRAFDEQEGMTSVPDWMYLTGSLSQLKQVWANYGADVENLPAGAMAMHPDIAIVIDPAGNIVQEVNADPGPATTTTQSSYSALFAADARQAMRQS